MKRWLTYFASEAVFVPLFVFAFYYNQVWAQNIVMFMCFLVGIFATLWLFTVPEEKKLASKVAAEPRTTAQMVWDRLTDVAYIACLVAFGWWWSAVMLTISSLNKEAMYSLREQRASSATSS